MRPAILARMPKHALVVSSLLTLLLTTIHLADDIVRGFAPGGFSNLTAVAVWVVWLYATLVLAERRSGYVIILLASLLAFGLPLIHMSGTHGMVGPKTAASPGAFYFVWTLLATAVIAPVCVALSARGLWSLRRGRLL
jgi:hypothetical protein